ncbi:MAG TPA: hypothetical protein VHN99_01410 [Deinococcales bacterium]|nr:hypothetical protein [Deinococcales bacterium]
MNPRLLAALAAVAFLPALAQADYYPFHAGQKWLYSSGETQSITGTRTVGGLKALVMQHAVGSRVSQEDFLLVRSDGVFMLGYAAGGAQVLYTPALQVYPAAPLAVGDRWSGSAKVGKSTVAVSSRVIAQEGVSVPAGRFNALVIRSSVTTSTGAASVADAYFVPGIGTVRYVTQDGSKVDLTGR